MKKGYIKAGRSFNQNNEEKDGKEGRRPKPQTAVERKAARKAANQSKKQNRNK